MKILAFGDIHFNNKSSVSFLNKEEDGYTFELHRAIKSIDFIIDYLNNSSDIDKVVCLGDVFHNLFSNDNIIISVCCRKFRELYETCKNKNIEFVILSGNHDVITDKDSLVYSLVGDLVLVDTFIDGNIAYIPYQVDNFRLSSSFYSALESDSVEYIFTHVSINDFMLSQKVCVKDGFTVGNVDKKIISGHLHIHQYSKNVIYPGSLKQINFADNSSIGHGFVIFDTKDDAFEFVRNTYVKDYKTIHIDKIDEDFIRNFEYERYCVVRLIVDKDIDWLSEVKNEFKSKEVSVVIDRRIKVETANKDVVMYSNFDTKQLVSDYLKYKHSNLLPIYKKIINKCKT